jgi:hypothetical protein
MDELEAKLAELEGKIQAFLAGVGTQCDGVQGELQTLEQGILSGLDSLLAEVESVRAQLMQGVADIEAAAAGLLPA